MNNIIVKFQLSINDDGAKVALKYNNTIITEAEARELKEAILETVYKKIDKFQNLKK